MSATFNLRPYQREAISAIRDAFQNRDIRRPLIVLPTGSGKTVVFSHLARLRAAAGRVLIIAHREELLTQAAEKIMHIAPDLTIGIVKAERDDHQYADVILASIQTIARPKRIAPLIGTIGTAIVDEAHHAAAQTYRDALKALGSFEPDGPLTVGVTATAGRGDGVGLGSVWQEIVYQRGIIHMIAEGYLVDVKGLEVTTDLDYGNVKTNRGDYADSSLGLEMENSGATEAAAEAYVKYAKDRRGVAFTPTIATSDELAKLLSARGVPAEHLSGKTPTHERRNILRRLKSGETQVVSNCAVLCLDEETEILTSAGWVGIDEMTTEHEVANWDQGRVWFAHPDEVVNRPRTATEEMYVLETPRRSIRVTGRHRMLYRTNRADFLKAPVDDLAGQCVELPTSGWAEPFDLAMPATKEMTAQEYRGSISANAFNLRKREGYAWDESFAEAGRRLDRRRGLVATPPGKLTLAEASLIGFWVGDGSINRLIRGGVEYTLSQSTRYPKIIEWIDGTIAACGVHVVRRDKSDTTVPHIRWSLPRGTGGGSQQRDGLYPIEQYLDKDGSALLWGLNREQFEAFITGFWYADGDHQLAKNGRPKSYRLHNTNKRLLDLLQCIASVRGFTASVRMASGPTQANHAQMYALHITGRVTHMMGGDDPSWRIQREQSPWRPERVWCVKTQSKNVVTRRRGSVTVMGNTEGFDEPALSCALIARPTKSKPLFTQMAGRVLRLYPGKQDALILNLFAPPEAGLATIADLAGLDPEKVPKPKPGETLTEAIIREDMERDAFGKRRTVASLTAKELHLFARSGLRWIPSGAGFVLPCGQTSLLLVPNGEDQWKVIQDARGDVKVISQDLTLEWAQGVGEEYARAHGGVIARADAKWRAKQPSPGQLSTLRKLRLPVPVTSGEASDAISAAIAGKTMAKLAIANG
jgi:superfamily II DNA or RNA helicase